jgi:hypothetical protein
MCGNRQADGGGVSGFQAAEGAARGLLKEPAGVAFDDARQNNMTVNVPLASLCRLASRGLP